MSEIDLTIKPDKFGIRDAIHVAVVSLRAAGSMYAGDPVIWHEKGKSVKVIDSCLASIGIVSAFMKNGVNEGDLVWIMLYPNTVTGMTHHWSHPDFDSPDLSIDLARNVITNTAIALDLYDCEGQDAYHYLLELATRYCKHQSGWWGHDNYNLSPESWENFWKAYSVVTGNPEPTENRVPFRCAC